MKETDWAYLAGLIDGDGTISIRHVHKNKYCPYVSIANTNRAALERCRDMMGSGSITTKRARKKNHLESYAVNWVYDVALKIVEKCLPYLIIKKDRAQALLDWKSCTPRNGYYTEELKRKKEALILKLKILNARGKWSNRKDLYEVQLKTIEPIKLKAQKK